MTTAKLSNLRISPRKVRLVVGLIRGKKVSEAQNQLAFVNKRSTEPVLKLLKSAIANAKNNSNANEKNLVISKIFVDCGPVLKRHMPRAFGRAAAIMKRTSHITIVLEDQDQDQNAKIKNQNDKSKSKIKKS